MNQQKERAPLKILENLGVIVRNTHVKLDDGSHCDISIDRLALYEDISQLRGLCLALTRYLIPIYDNIGIDTFLATSVDTYHIAQLIAERYDRFSGKKPVNVLVAEKDQDGEFFINHYDQRFIKGHNVLIVDDIFYIESHNTKLVNLTRELGGLVAGLTAILNLDSGRPLSKDGIFSVIPLASARFQIWLQDQCPDCQEIGLSEGKADDVLFSHFNL